MAFRFLRAVLSARAHGVVGAVVLFCASPFAAADPTGPISCVEGQFGIGGCPPYGQVIFFGAGITGPGSVFEYEDPVLDYSPAAPSGTVRGVVDLSQALVRTYAQAGDDGNPSNINGASMNAVGVDLFTLHRLGAPSPDFFTFSVVFTAEGVGGIDVPAHSVGAYLALRADAVNGGPLGFSGGKLDDARVLQAGNQVPVFQEFGVQLMTFANLSTRLDQPFMLSFSLRTDVMESSFLDFMHTARISFVLPEGVTVTSMGGYDSTVGVPAVPEPSTWLLLMAAGLAGTTRLARIQRREA